MDKTDVIHRRKGKYLAQLASDFEKEIEPRIPNDVAQRFKAKMRGALKSLAVDAAEIAVMDPHTELNNHAEAIRDKYERTRA